MTLPAARHADPAACSHGNTTVDASTTTLVEINGRPAAKLGSLAGCVPTGASVISGSGTVLINNAPAARATDRTTDGLIVIGSFDVLIGGPTTGLAGAVGAQTDACTAAGATRKSGSTSQSYGNCALETCRNLINRTRAEKGLPPITEDELLAEAHANGWAVNNPGGHNHGAASADGQQKLLEHHGIPAETQKQSVATVEQAVREGKGVAIMVHPYWWGSEVDPQGVPNAWLHEVAVTGVEYDAQGNVVAFIINDTGQGQCGKRLPVDELDRCLEKTFPMIVTEKKVW